MTVNTPWRIHTHGWLLTCFDILEIHWSFFSSLYFITEWLKSVSLAKCATPKSPKAQNLFLVQKSFSKKLFEFISIVSLTFTFLLIRLYFAVNNLSLTNSAQPLNLFFYCFYSKYARAALEAFWSPWTTNWQHLISQIAYHHLD